MSYSLNLIRIPAGILCLFVAISTLFSCGDRADIPTKVQRMSLEKQEEARAKFEPADGQVLVFAGQDLESIGGLSGYQDGYADHFSVPAGVTLYTSIGAGDAALGGNKKGGLRGIYETIDAGNGPSNMTLIMEDDNFKNCALAIGLSMVNDEKRVAAGELDKNIKKLGKFLLSLGDRPVFLRIGYEFDGYPWNHYEREAWIAAYKRIKDILDKEGVQNTAYVWQSVGFVSDPYQLEEWYPGDEYVDWCAFSFFNRWREVEMIDFARKKGKPVFIAEASATISAPTAKFDGQTKVTILSNSEHAQEAWEKWFAPFFSMIEDNPDVVKAVHYINCNWKVRPMWFNNPTFQNVDARIQESPMISAKWKAKMEQKRYLNASDAFFQNTK